MTGETPLAELVRSELVRFSQELGDAALNGELTGLVVVRLGPGGLTIGHCGTNPLEALAALQLAHVSMTQKILKG